MQIYDSIRAKSTHFFKQIRKYFTIIIWLIIDSFWRFKWKAAVALISGFFGVLFQVQSIVLVFYYAKAIDKGKVISLLGHEMDARSSIALLILCGIGVLFTLLLSAWLIYFSRTCNLKLMRKYEEFCSMRIISLFGSSLKISSPVSQAFYDDSKILRIARRDARYCGITLRILLLIITPLITFIVAIAFLFYLNVFLTLFIMLLMGVSTIFLYRVNRMGAHNSSLMEQHSSGASIEFRKIIRRHKTLALPALNDKSWHKIFNSGSVKAHLDGFIGRLRAVEQSSLVSDILLGVAIFGIIIVMGNNIISEKEGWGKLIIYLVALRYMLVNLKQTTVKLTSMNRFYPQLKRYLDFIQNAQFQPREEVKIPETYLIHADDGMLSGSLEKWKLHNGSRIGLISPVTLNRYNIAFLIESLFYTSRNDVESALNSMWFGTSHLPLLPGGLRESFGFSPEYTWQELRTEMEQAGMLERVKAQIPEDLDEPVSPEMLEGIDTDTKFAIALCHAIQSPAQWLMLEGEGFCSLPDVAREYFLKKFSNKIIVVVYSTDFIQAGKCNEEVIVVIDKERVIGIGNDHWLKQNEAAIKDILNQSPLSDVQWGYREKDDDDDLVDADF